jgi:Peptidase family S41/N-terminal domain of Peptidase_S41 in eukaryotic IRBP
MSEKIYAWLLRLYPSHFRKAYWDEALQLFRDRSRNERGFLPGTRLWMDLLTDLANSLPREHRRVQPAVIVAQAHRRSDGELSFHFLESESPGFGALLLGGVLSLAVVGLFSVLIRYAQAEHPAYARWFAVERPDPQPARGGEDGRMPSVPSRDAARAIVPAPPREQKLDATERERVLNTVIANLKQYYIDPAIAQKVADALSAHQKSGDYNGITDGVAFAGLLTRQMRDVSQDMNLIVVYNRVPTRDRPPGPTPESVARYRNAMEQQNCTFEEVTILPHNIGYLKLNSFPDPSICQPTAAAAMASLDSADAIIFDLRYNRGGYSGMVMLIGAYLFDHPEYMYNPRENTTERSWTRSPVPGSRLANKPVYILISSTTLSGAEHFSYDLKMLKRATLVGETTGGSAHAGTYHRVDEHFGMGITETRAINPFSNHDWEGMGVEPDVKVNAADALKKAQALAESRLRKRSSATPR